MPAATSKAELRAVAETEFGKLRKLIGEIPAEAALRKDDEDTSIRDVIAHRAHWVGLFLGWYADGQAGREVHIPAEGYNWGQLKAYNAALRARDADVGWDEARRRLDEAHGALMDFLGRTSEAALYGGPMAGGGNDWTAGRWAEAAGPSHYRSAARYVRARLRAAGAPAP